MTAQSPSASPPETPTKERILDASERLFAQNGFARTSLREVTRSAGVNLAAVHYHFGSKAHLFEAVFERRVGSINAERLARLDALESRDSQRSPSLEEVLEAFLGPALRLSGRRDEGWRLFMQLVGRMHSATGDHIHSVRHVFRDVVERFFPAFLAAAPHLTEEALHWRLHFLLGAMYTVLADPLRIKLASEGLCASDDPDEVLRQLVAFAAEGLRAPIPARPGEGTVG